MSNQPIPPRIRILQLQIEYHDRSPGATPLDRLKERFSDETAQRRFFALPKVQKVFGS